MSKWVNNIIELSKKENWPVSQFSLYIEKVEQRISVYESYLSDKKEQDIIYFFILNKTKKLYEFCIELKKVIKKT